MKKLYHQNSVTTDSTTPTRDANEFIYKSSFTKPAANNSFKNKPAKKSPSYIQDNILKDLIGEQKPVTMILMNGFQMNGKIISYDQYVINFKTSNGNNNMVFKHAISTIMIS